MEDLAEELFANISELKSAVDIQKILINPKCKLDNTSKISSSQNDLSVKLELTPKIIKSLREWYPETKLIGCKLLENVAKTELFEVGTGLCKSSKMDYIMANDLADLRKGKMTRYLINKDGFTGTELVDAKAVVDFIHTL